MKYQRQIINRFIRGVILLASMAFAQHAAAVCVQSDPPADPVLAIDANNGCDDIQGQDGCNIKDVASGSCTFTDSASGDFFTVESWLNADGSLS